jgi:hypothetical protein
MRVRSAVWRGVLGHAKGIVRAGSPDSQRPLATPAYGGALREARCSLVYLLPNLVLVHDKLASDT